MKNTVLVMSALLPFTSTAIVAETNNDELAQEIAYCYIAHKRLNSTEYVNQETNKYVDAMVKLVGEENLNLKINIAERRYDKVAGMTSMRSEKAEITRHCPSVDEQIAKLKF